jgi:hypothetical protein
MYVPFVKLESALISYEYKDELRSLFTNSKFSVYCYECSTGKRFRNLVSFNFIICSCLQNLACSILRGFHPRGFCFVDTKWERRVF